MTPHDKIAREIEKIIRDNIPRYEDMDITDIAKALAQRLLECVPEVKERFVRPGHKSNSRFNAKVEGWNMFRAELMRRLTGGKP